MLAQIRIHGRVQGVWFRAWTEATARTNKLDGWVRNCADGSVEALFQGDAEAVDAMCAACHQGPPLAAVSQVEVLRTSDADKPHITASGFHILADG